MNAQDGGAKKIWKEKICWKNKNAKLLCADRSKLNPKTKPAAKPKKAATPKASPKKAATPKASPKKSATPKASPKKSEAPKTPSPVARRSSRTRREPDRLQ